MATDFQSIYVLADGMLYQQRKLDVVANNLANVNTPGFKKDLINAQAYYINGEKELQKVNSPENPAANFVYPVIEGIHTVFSDGALIKTSNPFDLALQGEGFFAVKAGNQVLYTRNGHFLLNRDGYLVTQDGYLVLGTNGPIKIPPTAKRVSISKDGSVYVNGQKIAVLAVVDLSNPTKVGDNLYKGNPQGRAKNYTVLQGYLESSNVNPVKEMVRLIETQRAYEAMANSLKSEGDLASKVVNNVLKA